MNTIKIGNLIRRLRKEKQMTQAQLAEQLQVSDKAVSKWERGIGCPDVLFIAELSRIFEIDMQNLIAGELKRNELLNGNVKKMQFFVCPYCGNLMTSMTSAPMTCCGRKLQPCLPSKASTEQKLKVEAIENTFYITSEHEMTKEHYITFVALVTSDSVVLKKQYPEWDLQVRIPIFAHGRLLWYCNQHGLFYQEV